MKNNCYRYILCLISILYSCNRAENYKDAYLTVQDGKTYIHLYGKRNLMVHDLLSLFANKTYEDSVLISVPHFKQGIIQGTDLPFNDDGHNYFYSGNLIIKGAYLKVNLYYIYTVNNVKQKENYVWNGEYLLKKR